MEAGHLHNIYEEVAALGIFVFSDVYHDILAERLPCDELGCLAGINYVNIIDDGDVAERLAVIVAEIVGKSQLAGRIEEELRDFLSENEYIHIDAFINVCLEGIV